MQLTILQEKKEKVSFLLKDTTPAIANALRRIILDEVPTLAIEHVEFRKNSSILYDEIIAHRLGLVPLKTDLEMYVPQASCSCNGEGCAKCQVVGTLKAKGPCIVYASELKFKDPAIKAAFPNMAIAKLLKNQEVECEVTAVLGKGKDHAKWAPAHVFYRYAPQLAIGNVSNPEHIAVSCPTSVFDVKNKKLTVKNQNACVLCGACVELSAGEVKLNESDKEFVFFLESFGQLSPIEIIHKAFDLMEQQLDTFASKL